MVNSTAFPEPWGYDKLIGNNQTNIFGAALDVWRESAEYNLALDLTWGMIPLLLVAMIYIRTKNIDMALLVGLLAAYGLKAFNLISDYTSSGLFILMSLGLGLSFAYKLFNKN